MFIISPDLTPGDCVSVFADVEGKCKRGLVVEYEGRTLFVGNGHVKLSRQDLFGSHATNRLDGHHTLFQTTITCSEVALCTKLVLQQCCLQIENQSIPRNALSCCTKHGAFNLYPVLLLLLRLLSVLFLFEGLNNIQGGSYVYCQQHD